MKSLFSFLVASLASHCLAQIPAEPSPLEAPKFPIEQFRIEDTPVGKLVAIREISNPIGSSTFRVDATIKLGAYAAIAGEHLAFGIGNLYPHYDNPVRGVQGYGFIFGQWMGCPEHTIVIAIENYTNGGVQSSTCFGPVSREAYYRVSLELDRDRRVKLKVFADDSNPIPIHYAVLPAPITEDEDYPVGFFLVPVNLNMGSGPYELKSIKFFTQ